MSEYLSKEERAAINRQAYKLSQRAYQAYRHRLIEWATCEKIMRETVDQDLLAAQIPDISDMMDA